MRERQHVMDEITRSGVSHYGIRSMLSFVRLTGVRRALEARHFSGYTSSNAHV